MHDDKPEEHGWVGVRARFTRREPGPHTLKWIMVPAIFFVVVSMLGDLFAAALVDTHPALLAAMTPRIRNLVLVTNQLDATSFFVIGFVRLAISDPIYYLIGWYHGDRAIEWVENRHADAGQMVRGFEKFFAKAAYPLVIIAPNMYICVFAGAAGMRPGRFVVLNAAGTLGRLYLIRLFGEAFEEPIDVVLGFIKDYRIPLLLISAVVVAYTVGKQTRSGTGELGELLHLEEELDLKDRAANPDPRSDRGDPPPS